MKSFRSFLLIGLSMVAAGRTAFTADFSGVWVEAQVNTAAVGLGETFRLALTAGARNAAVQLPGANQIWSGCRLLHYEEEDVSRRHEGYTARQGRYTLAAFTLERVEVPPLSARFSWPDGTTLTAQSRPLVIKVGSLNPREGFELREARPPRPPGPFWLYLTLVPVTAGAIWLVWRRPARGRRAKRLPPPHLEAFQALDVLGKSRVVAEERVDQYFIQLSRVLRRYVWRHYNMPALELPRREIMHALSARRVPVRARRLLNSLLLRADLVKFAQARVDVTHIMQAQRRAHEFIERTRPAPEAAGGKKNRGRKDRTRV